MTISFFAPMFVTEGVGVERAALLRSTTHFFNFGQAAYTITALTETGTYVEKTDGVQPSKVGIILRIAAIATVVIPALMLIGLAIYRAMNSFTQGPVAECPICLDPLYKKVTLKCKHEFHRECIEAWKKTANSCPLDREPIEIDAV